MSLELGRLERAQLREVWQDEARDFTPWLADNLDLLADAIGTDLELEAIEKNVGAFRADILARDFSNNTLVLIENQLEPTDHRHLGQLLTYAAGLDAVTIIWVASTFREEHRAALDWLNDITGEDINFFGIEIELWRIGSSDIAPHIKLTSKPNDWRKRVIEANKQTDELTETKILQLKYWETFKENQLEKSKLIRPTKALPRHYMAFAVGRSGFSLNTIADIQRRRIGVDLYINDASLYFPQLAAYKDTIEERISPSLFWHEAKQKSGRIILYQEQVDIDNEADWNRQHAWLFKTLESFYRVFEPIIKTLDANANQLEDDADDYDVD